MRRWPPVERSLIVQPIRPWGFDRAASDGGNSLEMVVSGWLRQWLPWPGWLSYSALAWIPLNTLAFYPWVAPLGADARARSGAGLGHPAPTLGQMAALRLTQVVLIGLPIATPGLLRIRRGEGGLPAGGSGSRPDGHRILVLCDVSLILGPVFVLAGLRHQAQWLAISCEAPGSAAPPAPLLPGPQRAVSSPASGDPPISSDWASPIFPDSPGSREQPLTLSTGCRRSCSWGSPSASSSEGGAGCGWLSPGWPRSLRWVLASEWTAPSSDALVPALEVDPWGTA